MPIDYARLKVELVTDPNGYGLPALCQAGDLQGAAFQLSLPRDGTNGGPAITLRRPTIDPQTILEAIDTRDLLGTPSALAVAWFESACQAQQLRLLNEDGSDTRVMLNLRRLVGNAQGSQARLNAASNYTASRGEELFGQGTVIRATDIEIALQQV